MYIREIRKAKIKEKGRKWTAGSVHGKSKKNRLDGIYSIGKRNGKRRQAVVKQLASDQIQHFYS